MHAPQPSDEAPAPAPLSSRWAMPLALAVSLLLWAQWPLRDLVGAGATLANDIAQALFALYVAVALVHAGRRGTHIVARPDAAAAHPRWRGVGAALCVLPWALFLAVGAWAPAWQSLLQLEHFPETGHPGYFVIRGALLLAALGLAAQSAAVLWRAWRAARAEPR